MADQKTFHDFGIEVPPGGRGDVRAVCPACVNTRKKKREKPLSVNVEEGVWNCWHCGWTGGLKKGTTDKGNPHWWRELDRPKVYRKPEPTPRPETTEAQNARKAWGERMRERGIDAQVLRANKIDVRKVWMPQTEQEEWVLAYPYYREGELVNVKYRSADKHFKMEKDAEMILYRLDRIAGSDVDSVIIAEGENDALALEMAGLPNATSVPGGAPNPDASTFASKFLFLEDAYTADVLASKSEIVIAADADAPGRALTDELVRRLGPARCRVVQWPDGIKDANDMLQQRGPDALRKAVDAAPAYPLDGVISVRDFRDTLDDVYEFGLPEGPSTGWNSVDQVYRPAPGLLTIITGVPGSGKSRWVNSLLVNMARHHDARFAICSPEYRPTYLLASHLTETYIGKTMHPNYRNRMSREEYEHGARWVDEHMHFIVPQTTTIGEILERAALVVARFGVRGLLIDPWTEVEIVRSNGQTEVDALKAHLALVQRFAYEHNVHVWVVAHPTKLDNTRGGSTGVPGLNDIAGGAQWGNKSDFVVSIWRDKSSGSPEVELHMQKVRFQHLGQDGGMAVLNFDPLTGRYADNSSDGATGGRSWSSIA